MKIDQCPSDITMAAGMAALAHPARIRILKELAKSPACCCKDVVGRLDLAQSTVSQHLKVLVDAGLVVYSPDKQRSSYSLNADALHDLAASLDGLASACTASLTKICGKQVA